MEIESTKAKKYRNTLDFYDKQVQNWLVDMYKQHKSKLDRIIINAIEDYTFPLYTEESEFNKLSYNVYAKINKKYPFIEDSLEMLKLFLKEYHKKINSNNCMDTYIKSEIDNLIKWLEKTKEKYNINLQSFAEY